MSPPMTGTARGTLNSAPSPGMRARGRRPRTVVMVDMRMGRRRTCPAFTRASSRAYPSSLRRTFTKSTRTMALFTTMPTSITIPTRATTEMEFPVSQRAATAPGRANGTETRITPGWRKDSNWLAMTRYTRKMARRKASCMERTDSWRSRDCPATAMTMSWGGEILAMAVSMREMAPARSVPVDWASTRATRDRPRRMISDGPSWKPRSATAARPTLPPPGISSRRLARSSRVALCSSRARTRTVRSRSRSVNSVASAPLTLAWRASAASPTVRP